MPVELWIIKDDEAVAEVRDVALQCCADQKHVRVARSVAEAEAFLKNCLTPDVAVVDPHLTPEDETRKDGIQLIETIRKAAQDCLIICFTQEGETNLGVRAYQAGADDYIGQDLPYVNGDRLLREQLRIFIQLALERNEAGAEELQGKRG